jgi:hypothetical protein
MHHQKKRGTMRRLGLVLFFILIGLAIAGCGKKSGLEGKIIDGKGEPMANIKMIAKQIQPIKGYEQFEAITGSDGTFSFKKLFPTSDYILFPWFDDWSSAPQRTLKYEADKLTARFHQDGWITENKMKVLSGPEGQTIILKSPIAIMPTVSIVEGKIIDGKGEPMGNVKMIAKQIQPIKGYEQFEAVTGSNGTFSFKKLFPTSDYILFPWFDDWSSAPQRTLKYEADKLTARFHQDGWITENKMKVLSGPEGQTIILESPIAIMPTVSIVEGKIVDGKDEPMGNVKMIAKQIQPIKGYEQFEAVTGSDGTFSFKKLFPTSDYILFPWFDDWSSTPQRTLKYEANKLTARFNKDGWITEDKMKVLSAPEGQNIILKSPIAIMPTVSIVEGKIVDGKGGPMGNVKIIAKQVQPIKGYEQFEAVTDSDGAFSFKKLFPTSDYVLFPWFDDWSSAPQRTLKYEANKLTARFNKDDWITEDKMKVLSASEGQTIMLRSLIIIKPCISTVTVKLLDDRKRPIKGIKIVAKQVNPTPGYEQFESTTDDDGSFSFKKLYPNSKYLFIFGSKFKTVGDEKRIIRTKGEQRVIQGRLSFRFILVNEVLSDTRTELEWFAGPNKKTKWKEAQAWVENLNIAGGGWRLPTLKEFITFHKTGKMNSLLKYNGSYIWSGDKASPSGRHVAFTNGSGYYISKAKSFAVRSRKQ